MESNPLGKRGSLFLGLKVFFVLIGFAALMPLVTVSCGGGGGGGADPGTLRLYIDPVQFEGLSSLSLHTTRVEVVISGVPGGEEEILVINSEPDTASLVGFASVTPGLFSMYTIYREGYISQIRFIVDYAEATVGPDTYAVDIPSGAQTGEKVIAADQTIQIIDGAQTSVTIRLDVEHSVLQNAGQGYKLKPVIKAESGVTTALPIDEYVPNQVTALFSETATQAEIEGLVSQMSATVVSANPYFPFYVLQLPSSTSVEDAKAFLNASPLVRVSVPNYIMFSAATPNDPSFSLLWGMNNTGQTGGNANADIDAPEAWNLTTGSSNIVVAVIDTGVDQTHPDLAQNLWTNQAEANGISNVDDDGNGFVDDIHGWNFISNSNNTQDDHGHGTHVAGTIGAVGNNGTGVAGVNWTVTIMPIKVLASNGRGTFAAYFNALAYAAQNGAHVTSASLGGIVSDSISNYNSLYDAANTGSMLNIVAAGNEGLNIDKDPRLWIPAEIDRSNLITVGATDHSDSIASFSNYGSTSVDLTAPGVDILSTTWGGGTGYMSGTSMATPHVSGVAALVLSRYPEFIGNPSGLRTRIESGVDVVSGHGNIRTGGRLNAYNAAY